MRQDSNLWVGPDFCEEVTDAEVTRAIKSVPRHRSMVAFGASGKTIASTSTLTTMLGIKCPSNQAVTCDEVDAGFDGTNSANGPGIVDLCHCTFATSPPGTSSTSLSAGTSGFMTSDSGRPETIQSTAGKTWTAEPTVKLILKSFLVPTYMGSSLQPLPQLKPMIAKGGGGISVQNTLPSAVTANFTGTIMSTE